MGSEASRKEERRAGQALNLLAECHGRGVPPLIIVSNAGPQEAAGRRV